MPCALRVGHRVGMTSLKRQNARNMCKGQANSIRCNTDTPHWNSCTASAYCSNVAQGEPTPPHLHACSLRFCIAAKFLPRRNRLRRARIGYTRTHVWLERHQSQAKSHNACTCSGCMYCQLQATSHACTCPGCARLPCMPPASMCTHTYIAKNVDCFVHAGVRRNRGVLRIPLNDFAVLRDLYALPG